MLRRLTPALDHVARPQLVQRALYLHKLVAVCGIHGGGLDIPFDHLPGPAGDALCALSDPAHLCQREGGQNKPERYRTEHPQERPPARLTRLLLDHRGGRIGAGQECFAAVQAVKQEGRVHGRQPDNQKRDQTEPRQGSGLGPDPHGLSGAGVQEDALMGERVHKPLGRAIRSLQGRPSATTVSSMQRPPKSVTAP